MAIAPKNKMYIKTEYINKIMVDMYNTLLLRIIFQRINDNIANIGNIINGPAKIYILI